MKENNQKRIILSIMAIAVLIAVLAAGTYAFFAATVTGEDTSVQITASSDGSTIRFTGGETVNLTGIYPRSAAWLTKDITLSTTAVSGATSKPVYSFNIVVTDNDYELGDIQYTFTNKVHTGVDAGYTEVSTKTNMETMFDIAHGTVDLTQNATITYTLNVYFVNAEDRNQNTGNNRNLRFYISYNWGNPVNVTTNIDGVQKTYKIPENSSIYLNTPRKEGYDFLNWTVSGGTLSGNQLSIGKSAVTLTANFQKQIRPVSFAEDSWETIATAVRNGNTSVYKVGDTREITIDAAPFVTRDGDYEKEYDISGTYTLRLVNNSNYNCDLRNESGCGFVVQFAENIKTMPLYYAYSSDGSGTDPFNKCVDLRETTSYYMYYDDYRYYTNSIYEKLPNDLKESIIYTQTYGLFPENIGGVNLDGWYADYLDSSIKIQSSNYDRDYRSYYLFPLNGIELFGEVPSFYNDVLNDYFGSYSQNNVYTSTRQLDFYAGGFEYSGSVLPKVSYNVNTSSANYPIKQLLRDSRMKYNISPFYSDASDNPNAYEGKLWLQFAGYGCDEGFGKIYSEEPYYDEDYYLPAFRIG